MSSDEIQEWPEVGELVLAFTRKVTKHGVNVILEEYEDMPGFLHISEVATGWVKNIGRFITVNQKIVLKVTRVNEGRGEIDLSLRQVGTEERKKKLISIKRYDKSSAIFDSMQMKLKITDDDKENYFQMVEDEFEFAYNGLESLVKNGESAFKNLDMPDKIVDMLKTISKDKIIIPLVSVTGTMEITSLEADGVNLIKRILTDINKTKSKTNNVEIYYLGAPKYKITAFSEKYKKAEKILASSVEKIEKSLHNKGKFSFTKNK